MHASFAIADCRSTPAGSAVSVLWLECMGHAGPEPPAADRTHTYTQAADRDASGANSYTAPADVRSCDACPADAHPTDADSAHVRAADRNGHARSAHEDPGAAHRHAHPTHSHIDPAHRDDASSNVLPGPSHGGACGRHRGTQHIHAGANAGCRGRGRTPAVGDRGRRRDCGRWDGGLVLCRPQDEAKLGAGRETGTAFS